MLCKQPRNGGRPNASVWRRSKVRAFSAQKKRPSRAGGIGVTTAPNVRTHYLYNAAHFPRCWVT